MKNKKKLAQLALAGLILASQLPSTGHSFDNQITGTLLAAGGCGESSCKSKGSSQIADAGGDLSFPRTGPTTTGNYGARNSPSNVSGPYRNDPVRTSNRPSDIGTNVGGSYSIPENRYGSTSDAGSWSGTTGSDLNRARVQEYNTNAYNTNRNSATNPAYQGKYLDSSFYSDTVAPYGAPNTEGYDKNNSGSAGYGYEGIVTSGIMTEFQLKQILSPSAWSTYEKLDGEGRALALQLASQSNLRNKDLAVKEAFYRMQERRGYEQTL